MRARQSNDVLILELEGQLDFETTRELHGRCDELMKKFNSDLVLFDMGKLKFVGSSGISLFITVLKELNRKKGKLKMCNLSMEFTKVFKAYQTTRRPFEIFESEDEAIESYGSQTSRKPVGNA